MRHTELRVALFPEYELSLWVAAYSVFYKLPAHCGAFHPCAAYWVRCRQALVNVIDETHHNEIRLPYTVTPSGSVLVVRCSQIPHATVDHLG